MVSRMATISRWIRGDASSASVTGRARRRSTGSPTCTISSGGGFLLGTARMLRCIVADVNCKAEPGRYRPVVNRAKCEAKAACVAVCPYQVFEVRRIDDASWRELPVLAKLKVWAHRKQSAYAVRADACRACGSCVAACPEKAITLVPTP